MNFLKKFFYLIDKMPMRTLDNNYPTEVDISYKCSLPNYEKTKSLF